MNEVNKKSEELLQAVPPFSEKILIYRKREGGKNKKVTKEENNAEMNTCTL